MNPPRPLLNIEMFEDRLLPSTFAIGGFDPNATFPTNTFHASVWRQQDGAASDSGREGNFIPQSSTNLNSTSDIQDQATPSEDTAFPILSTNQNYVSFSPRSPLLSFRESFRNLESSDRTLNNSFFHSEASNNLASDGISSPQPLAGEASSPQSVIVVLIGLEGDGLNRFSDFRNVADSSDGQWPPWFNHDYQTSGINPPDGTNSSDPPSGSVGDNSSSQADSVAPLEVAAPSSPPAPPSAPASAPSTPEQFLASISPQSGGGQSTISEQLPPSEQHILSEITLAAVSLMGSQAAPSTPMLPTVVIPSPNSATELLLPSPTVDRTTVRVKAPTPVPVKEVAETVIAPLPPIEIHAPTGVPVAGAIGLDAVELDARVSRVMASISNLGEELTEELEQPEAYAWLVAAGLLSFGAGYVVWINQKSQRVVGFPFGRGSLGVWEGEEYDARNR